MKPGRGEPCLDDFCDWEEGLTCLPTGVCGPPPKLGEPCLHGCADDCISPFRVTTCGI